MREITILWIIVGIDSLGTLAGIALALWLHRKDSGQQRDFSDEQLEILNQIADALNKEEVEAYEHNDEEGNQRGRGRGVEPV